MAYEGFQTIEHGLLSAKHNDGVFVQRCHCALEDILRSSTRYIPIYPLRIPISPDSGLSGVFYGVLGMF